MAEKKTKTKNKDIAKLNLEDARKELKSVYIKVKVGEETDTSKIKKLKKHIARLLTKETN